MSPIATVDDPPISTRENTSIFLRPIRSPKCPKTIAPAGRDTNATPNVANAASVPDSGLNDGKNAFPNTRAAAVPKMKKSYHSIAVPTKDAKATVRGLTRVTSRSSMTLISNLPSLLMWGGAAAVSIRCHRSCDRAVGPRPGFADRTSHQHRHPVWPRSQV